MVGSVLWVELEKGYKNIPLNPRAHTYTERELNSFSINFISVIGGI